MPSSIQTYLIDDPYKPLFENESLQQWDNYCIYSIVCIDKTYLKHTVKIAGNGGGYIYNYPEPLITDTVNVVQGDNLLAIQTFSTTPIPINFLDYVNQYHE